MSDARQLPRLPSRAGRTGRGGSRSHAPRGRASATSAATSIDAADAEAERDRPPAGLEQRGSHRQPRSCRPPAAARCQAGRSPRAGRRRGRELVPEVRLEPGALERPQATSTSSGAAARSSTGRATKMSWSVMISDSMPTTSVICETRREPSTSRDEVDDHVERARDLLAHCAAAGSSMPDISTIVSRRRERVARRVRVDRRQRALVTGVHRLEHVERLGAANLADDDPVGAHAQRVADELADPDLALALDVRRAATRAGPRAPAGAGARPRPRS